MRLSAILPILLAWGLGGTAWAEGIVCPDTAERDHPVAISLEAEIPDGAKTMGPGWQLSPGLNSYRVSDGLIVVAAAPGTYQISYQIFWIHLEPVTLFDANGNEITIMSYLGHGTYDDTATLTITGEDPGPDPPDPPDPDPQGPWRIMLFYDARMLDNLPSEQRQILTSLAVREQLVADGHNLLEVLEDAVFSAGSVPADYQPWVNAAKKHSVPSIAIAPKSEAGTIRVYPLPANRADLMELLEAPP